MMSMTVLKIALENLTADHLLWQLNLMPLTERDMLIARVLADSINSDGFLDADLEEITKPSLKNSRIWNMTKSTRFTPNPTFRSCGNWSQGLQNH